MDADGKIPKDLGKKYGKMILESDGFAQVYPEHKYLIVEALRQEGFACGMTGDGVNGEHPARLSSRPPRCSPPRAPSRPAPPTHPHPPPTHPRPQQTPPPSSALMLVSLSRAPLTLPAPPPTWC
jgi:hypothetical protein